MYRHPQGIPAAGWLGCWLISMASATIVVNSEVLGRDNATRPLLPNDLELMDRRPGASHDRRRSTEVDSTAYNIRHTNDIGSYIFGYDNAKDSLGNEHFRFEQRFANGTVIGEYGFTDYLNSVIVTVTYTADKNGYRPIVNMRRFQDFI